MTKSTTTLIIFASGSFLLFLNSHESVAWRQAIHPSYFHEESPSSKSNPTSNSNSNPNPSHCWLDPPWGITPNNKTTALSHVSSQPRVCAERAYRGASADNILHPWTTAKTLTCSPGANSAAAAAAASSTSTSTNTNTNELLSSPGYLGPDESSTITIILLYYADPRQLLKQIEHLSRFPDHLQEKISLLIVDDGSPPGLQAREYILLSTPKKRNNSTLRGLLHPGFPVQLVRVVEDIPWNMPGAQNLGVFLAPTNKILLLDLDTMISTQVFERLLTKALSTTRYPHVAHKFFLGNHSDTTTTAAVLHPKIMFLSKDTYWSIGGYEEDFVGHYGHDDYAFWYRCKLNPGCHVDMETNQGQDQLYIYGGGGSSSSSGKKHSRCDDLGLGEEAALVQKEACEKALTTLPRPPKRSDIPFNRKLFLRRKFTQCWSNHYLRFLWVNDDVKFNNTRSR